MFTIPHAVALAAIAMSLPAGHGDRYAAMMRHDHDVDRSFRESFTAAYDAMRYEAVTY